jgi:hypothetical protein
MILFLIALGRELGRELRRELGPELWCEHLVDEQASTCDSSCAKCKVFESVSFLLRGKKCSEKNIEPECIQYAGSVITGSMQAICRQYAGSMQAICMQYAGSMQAVNNNNNNTKQP